MPGNSGLLGRYRVGRSAAYAQVREAAKAREKNLRLQALVLQEIVSTETSYVHFLKEVVEAVIRPLQDGKIISKADGAAIFQNWETLANLHASFLSDLEEDVSVTGFGVQFETFAPYFRMYSQVRNHTLVHPVLLYMSLFLCISLAVYQCLRLRDCSSRQAKKEGQEARLSRQEM
jgi:hypothetical protein